jgi:hypothetical protein
MKAAINTLDNIVQDLPPRLIKGDRTSVLTKDMTFGRLGTVLSRKDTCHIFDIEENEY